MFLLKDRYRGVIVLITFICLTSISSNYIIINFTFICMQQDVIVTEQNTTVSKYTYTPLEKSYIMWAVAIGTLLATFPINFLYTRYGAKYPFFMSGLISTFSTFFMPFAADLGLWYLLILRFLQGVAYSADFSAIGLVCVRWAPLRETSLFIALLTMFTIVSGAITNSLCESSLGWRYTFYLHASAGFLVFLLWLTFYSDSPRMSSRVSEKELRVIEKGKSEQHKEGVKTIPYLKLLSHPAILCVWFSAFIEMSSYILLSTYAPIYFNSVLRYNIGSTGIVVGAATITQIPVKVIAALFSDKVNYFSEMVKIHFFNTLAMGGVGALFAVLGYVDYTDAWLAVLIYTLINWCFTVNCAGFYKCATHCARQYSHVVIGTIQWMKCVALFTAPALVGALVTDESDRSQWRIVFLVAAAFMVASNVMAFPLFTDKPAEFTKSNEDKRVTEIQLQ